MNQKRLQWFFDLAKAQARRSDVKYFHHGAVLARKSKIIETGFNHYVSNHDSCYIEYSALHAERDVIEKALKRGCALRGATIYVVRVNKRGQLRNSKPCQECAKLILEHGIRRVFYSISETDALKQEIVSLEDVPRVCKDKY